MFRVQFYVFSIIFDIGIMIIVLFDVILFLAILVVDFVIIRSLTSFIVIFIIFISILQFIIVFSTVPSSRITLITVLSLYSLSPAPLLPSVITITASAINPLRF